MIRVRFRVNWSFMFSSFLPCLLFSGRASMLRHMWRMNKFSNFKICRHIYSHCPWLKKGKDEEKNESRQGESRIRHLKTIGIAAVTHLTPRLHKIHAVRMTNWPFGVFELRQARRIHDQLLPFYLVSISYSPLPLLYCTLVVVLAYIYAYRIVCLAYMNMLNKVDHNHWYILQFH